MNQTKGAARHPYATILEVHGAHTQQAGALDLACHDLQLALPWLAAAAPESLAAIRAYLLQHDTPALRRKLRRRLAQGEDAGLQRLLSQALGHLLHGQVRA